MKTVVLHKCAHTNDCTRCSCWIGHRLRADNKTCHCATNNGGSEHKCKHKNVSVGLVHLLRTSHKLCYVFYPTGIDIEVVDSCATNNGGCEHKCKHKNGAAVCSCRAGYLLQADNKTCHDVDECSTGESCCAQECTNNPGGYTCGCKHGFRLNKNGCGCDGMLNYL